MHGNFIRMHNFPSEPTVLRSFHGRGSVERGNGGLRAEALAAGIWSSEEGPFLNSNETGNRKRLTMAKKLAGMPAVTDVPSVAPMVRSRQVGPSTS